MATLSCKFLAAQRVSRGHSCRHSNSGTWLLAMGALLLIARRADAQAPQQQYVFASTPTSANTSVVAAFSKDSQTGSLTAVTGSPFNERMEGGFLAIDGLGKFLFVLNPTSNNISMFRIDQSTGGLTEVAASPFSTGPTENPSMAAMSPVFLATEKSGQFLYAGYRFGNFPGQGAVNEYRIDATNSQLVPLAGQPTTDIASAPIGMLTDPKGLHLYIGLGPNPTTGIPYAGTQVYSIDPLTGKLALLGPAGGGDQTGRCIAMDPQARFFFDGWGSASGSLDSSLISPVDGTATVSKTISLGLNDFPTALLVDSSGKFLYVAQSGGVFVYAVDQTTGVLTPIPGGPVPLIFSTGTAVADPMGPFIYALTSGTVQGFQVDPVTGGLTKIAATSTGGQGVLGIAISGQPVQAVSGPVAVLFPSSFDFGGATVGQPDVTRIVHLVNTGNALLHVNQIAMTGTNASDFVATPAASCQPATVLLPNASCAISLVFTPAAAGLRKASLTATDDAPGSPQSIPISGTGVPATSAVTLAPGNVSFPTITQGTTETPQDINLTNSGTAKLNIFSVVLGGANPNDFSMANACTGALAVNASCTITVTFAPLAAGGRSATVTITDDAPGSQQTILLGGNASPAFAVTPAPSGSTSATVAAGHTAQFNLQLTPGAGFNGSVSLACTGAPMAAKCTAPSVVQVTNGNPMPFSVTVTTSGSGAMIPVLQSPRLPPFVSLRWLALLVLCLLLLFRCFSWTVRELSSSARHLALNGASTAAVLLALFGSAGCAGGGGASPAQIQTPSTAPIVTPSGISTLTLTMTVSTASGKSLAPPSPVQLTLTVN